MDSRLDGSSGEGAFRNDHGGIRRGSCSRPRRSSRRLHARQRRDHVEGRCGNVISGRPSQGNPNATRARRGDGSLRCADLPDFGHHRLPGRRVFARRPHCGGSAREYHRRSTSHIAVQRRQSVPRIGGAEWTRTQRRSHGRPDRRPYVRRTDRVPDRQSTGEDPPVGIHRPASTEAECGGAGFLVSAAEIRGGPLSPHRSAGTARGMSGPTRRTRRPRSRTSTPDHS